MSSLLLSFITFFCSLFALLLFCCCCYCCCLLYFLPPFELLLLSLVICRCGMFRFVLIQNFCQFSILLHRFLFLHSPYPTNACQSFTVGGGSQQWWIPSSVSSVYLWVISCCIFGYIFVLTTIVISFPCNCHYGLRLKDSNPVQSCMW